jgi:hypothetical protein
VIGLGLLRASGRTGWQWNSATVAVVLTSITLIAGSLAALYRNEFWSRYEGQSTIPRMEESISRSGKIVLWGLFAIGCASLGLLLLG